MSLPLTFSGLQLNGSATATPIPFPRLRLTETREVAERLVFGHMARASPGFPKTELVQTSQAEGPSEISVHFSAPKQMHSFQNRLVSAWVFFWNLTFGSRNTHSAFRNFCGFPFGFLLTKTTRTKFAAPAARLERRLQGLRPVHLLIGRQHGVARHQTPEARLLGCSAARLLRSGDRGWGGPVGAGCGSPVNMVRNSVD